MTVRACVRSCLEPEKPSIATNGGSIHLAHPSSSAPAARPPSHAKRVLAPRTSDARAAVPWSEHVSLLFGGVGGHCFDYRLRLGLTRARLTDHLLLTPS